MKDKSKKLLTTHYSLLTKKGGFTLIEVLLSVFILTVGVGSMMVLISDSLQTIHVAKNSVVAANLAQEGIEVVRGIRDANWIKNEPDPPGYTTGFTDGSHCVNYDSTALVACSPNFELYWDSGLSKYTHTTSATTRPTIFEREIVIRPTQTDVDGNPYIQVQSIVRWGTREIVAETHLYDWH